jgi:PAS domain S-box-containing protein
MNKILAIDDKQDNLITISALLKNLIKNCTVITAQSGPEGIEKAINEMPDIIILDVKMPDMDGFEVCSRLKGNEATRHIPIILLTAIKTDAASRIRGLDLGADAFLTKPIDETELIAQIKVMLRIKTAEDQLRREKDLLEEKVVERTKAVFKSQQKLIKERDFIKSLNDASPAYYIAIDEGGNIVDMGKALLNVFGYSVKEVRGKNFLETFLPDFERNRVMKAISMYKTSDILQFECTLSDGKGREILVEWHGKPVFRKEEGLDFIIFIGIDITERKRLEKVVLNDSEKERNRIGQDLHDGLGQHLAGIAFKSEILKLKLQDKGLEESSDVNEIITLVNQSLNQARDLAKGLCPVDMAGGGLRSALEDLRTNVKNMFNVNCLINWGDNVSIEGDMEASQLYYIIKEAVNNSMKHGKSKNIIISFTNLDQAIRIIIIDDGTGMPDDVIDSKGMGLSIMQYRAWIIGATFNISRNQAGGTIITCLLKDSSSATFTPQQAAVSDNREAASHGKKNSVLVVDDHPIVRQGLVQIINRETDLYVCGEAKSADEAMVMVGRIKPHILIVDISLKGASGIDLISSIKSRYGEIPVLVLSIHDESLYAERAMRVGARGYVMKREAPQTIVKAIRTVLEGKQYLSDKMKDKLLDNISYDKSEHLKSLLDGLTNREFEIFQFIGNGLSNKNIAEKLNISIKTVENYRDRIKNKLRFESSTDVAQIAVQYVIDSTQGK